MKLRSARWIAGVSFVAVLLSLAPAEATVVGGTVVGESSVAKFIKRSVPLPNPVGPPNSVGQDTCQLPNLYAFDKDQNIKLNSNLTTDVGKNPIPAGTVIASHYVFLDPGPGELMLGTADFDSRVVAINTSTDNLAASDFLANTCVHYRNHGARILEPVDSVTISGPSQITFDTQAGSPGDYARVLTEFRRRVLRITSLAIEEPFGHATGAGMAMVVDRRKWGAGSATLWLLL